MNNTSQRIFKLTEEIILSCIIDVNQTISQRNFIFYHNVNALYNKHLYIYVAIVHYIEVSWRCYSPSRILMICSFVPHYHRYQRHEIIRSRLRSNLLENYTKKLYLVMRKRFLIARLTLPLRYIF